MAEARSFARPHDSVVIEPVQRELDRRALEQLALASAAFSPCVGLEEADAPECLLMDVTGIGHCFGDETTLTKRVDQQFAAQHFKTRLAIGNGLGEAWAAAHFLATYQQPMVVPGDSQTLFGRLPIAALRLPRPTIRKLHRLGITDIRQLLDLKRAALAPRFGGELLLRLDQFTGIRLESITPCRPPPRFHIEHTLEEGITHPLAFEQLWSESLEHLAHRLQQRKLGTTHLRCEFILQNNRIRKVAVRLCEAVNNAPHIADLLRLKLDNFHLVAPLVGLRMEAFDVAPLRRSQAGMFDGTAERGHLFSKLLNRLSSRLGETNVTYAQILPDPIPERTVHRVPVTQRVPPTCSVSNSLFPFDRPTCLFPEPRLVEVLAVLPDGTPAAIHWKGSRFDITSYWGPERIESGWWRGRSERRDYYRVETKLGQRFWIFRRLQDRQWFWHGKVF